MQKWEIVFSVYDKIVFAFVLHNALWFLSLINAPGCRPSRHNTQFYKVAPLTFTIESSESSRVEWGESLRHGKGLIYWQMCGRKRESNVRILYTSRIYIYYHGSWLCGWPCLIRHQEVLNIIHAYMELTINRILK